EELGAVEGVLDWQLERYGDGLARLVAQFEKAVARGEVPRRKPWKRG
ncbi:MAG: hypothetical protein GY711_18115, partial [bacterium]|nr:hypothetical protein [bacterium]